MDKIEHSLSRIEDSFWSSLYSQSATKSARLHKIEWWHNKMYEYNPPNSGAVEQVVFKGLHRDVPWEREFFYPSVNGRFALGEDPVAYFSRNFAVTCCEVVEQFRSNACLSPDELLDYLQGDVEADGYGYPLSVRIETGAVVADMTSVGSRLLVEMVRVGDLGSAADFFDGIIRSWAPDSRRATQTIAGVLKNRGYHGVVFNSVRTPTGVVLSSKNLVLFSDDFLIRNPFDPNNPKGFMWKSGSIVSDNC